SLEGTSSQVACTVNAPGGEQVDVTTPGAEITVNGYELGARFVTETAGDYTVACNSPTVLGHDVGAGESFGYVGGRLFGGRGGLRGIGLTIAGGVWWASRRP